MKRGLPLSILLHVVIFLIIYFGLPSLFDKKILDEQIVTVELLPVSELTNIKQKQAKKTEKKQTPKEKPQPATKAKPQPAPKPEPQKKTPLPKLTPEKKPEIKPVIKPEVKQPPPAKKEEEKPIIKPKPKQEPAKSKKEKTEYDEADFSSVLKSVEEIQKNTEDSNTNDDFSAVEDFLSNTTNDSYKEALPLTLSEKEAIKQQIMKNWTVLSGARDAKDIIVSLKIELAIDGTVTNVEIVDNMRYNKDSFYRALVDSAVRAVYKSSPLQNLPVEKYHAKNGWRNLQLNFDPTQILY